MFELPDQYRAPSVSNLARVLNKYIDDFQVNQKFILKFKISSDPAEAEQHYQRYLEFKSLINHSTKVSVALEITDLKLTIHIAKRFWSEVVQLVIVNKDTFKTNKNKLPFLAIELQKAIKSFMRC
mmetsp:Transcript_11386/g.19202  ORF Transcript_11386/g.19202 Transcript_11386/m.19202 type:complete len:125 (+) Transcript_11386:395-769(+)